jgi:dihydroxy-acid dehydratase
MKYFIGKAVVFDDEDNALASFSGHKIKSGDVVVILNQGPVANGMPEMFRISDVITHYHIEDIAVITDGRYSGCTSGPAIGYISPESSIGGPLGLIRTGDFIEIDIPKRTVNLVIKTNEGGYVPADDVINARALTAKPYDGPVDMCGARSIHRGFVMQASKGAIMQNGK